MDQYYDYCSVVEDNVTVQYHAQEIPVLKKGRVKGSNYIDKCSHMEQCNVGTSDCPLFKKLNNL